MHFLSSRGLKIWVGIALLKKKEMYFFEKAAVGKKAVEKNMEKDFTVHKERNDERIHMLESPGHKHLCRESKESQSDKPHPLNSFRHGETAFHKSRPYGDTENLEIENNFRI